MKERRKDSNDRRKFQTGQHSNWDGFERRKGPRRQDEDDFEVAVLELDEYERKQRLKMERREKEKKLKDQRKRGRLKKELGLN